jgi:3-phenylpropionate/trans-cinnamate dioxygenase ferredoxin component
MAEFVKVGSLSQFQPGVVNECEVDGRRILVVNAGGTVHAVGNVCPHVSLPLVGGHIDGDAIVCPFHGSAFKLATGEGVEGPATGDSIDVYAVRVEGDDVLIAKS